MTSLCRKSNSLHAIYPRGLLMFSPHYDVCVAIIETEKSKTSSLEIPWRTYTAHYNILVGKIRLSICLRKHHCDGNIQFLLRCFTAFEVFYYALNRSCLPTK